MHITIPNEDGPLTCSKCGSHRAVHPLNQSEVIARCEDCGHEKRKPTPEEDRSHKERFDALINVASTKRAKRAPTF